MKKELELKLVEEFPEIFRDYGGDRRLTCMGRGFEHGDGWFKALQGGCRKLQALNTVSVVAEQVKEKFGGLRFYFKIIGDPEARDRHCGIVQAIVTGMEKECWATCEDCGSQENMCTTTGWVGRICHKCASKLTQNSIFTDDRDKGKLGLRLKYLVSEPDSGFWTCDRCGYRNYRERGSDRPIDSCDVCGLEIKYKPVEPVNVVTKNDKK